MNTKNVEKGTQNTLSPNEVEVGINIYESHLDSFDI